MTPDVKLLHKRATFPQWLLELWRANVRSCSTETWLFIGEAIFVMGWSLLWASGVDLISFPIWLSLLLMVTGLLAIPYVNRLQTGRK
jgi:hypothetical protein